MGLIQEEAGACTGMPRKSSSAAKNDMDLKDLLFSPVKNVASWLQQSDKMMPSLDDASVPSPGELTVAASEMEEDDAPISNTPKANNVSPQNQFDPFRDIANFFSPLPKKKETSRVKHVSPSPLAQDSPRRLSFEAEAETPVEPTAPTREVATVKDLYKDAGTYLEKMLKSTKEANYREWWEKARQVDPKELAEKARSSTKRTAKQMEGRVAELMNTAKEIEPKVVVKNAQKSAKEVADAVRSNAQVHPLPWAIIGVFCFAILVQYLFFSDSVGTPAMRYWRFSVRVHKSAPGNVVDRVANFLQSHVGPEADQILSSARSSGAISGQDILSRLSQSLEEPIDDEPDVLDMVQLHIDMVRENPRHYYNLALSTSKSFVLDVWNRGRQLTTDAFDEVTVL